MRPETYPHVRRLDTVFGDMDVQGHINNVAIARLFEEGRSSLHRAIRDVVAGAFSGMVLARIEIDYVRELSYPGVVDIAIGISRIGTKSYQQAAALFRDDECAALSTATSVRVSPDRTHTVPITDAERAALEKFRIRGGA
jgi:acyl-CoA thioester hydrolase